MDNQSLTECTVSFRWAQGPVSGKLSPVSGTAGLWSSSWLAGRAIASGSASGPDLPAPPPRPPDPRRQEREEHQAECERHRGDDGGLDGMEHGERDDAR